MSGPTSGRRLPWLNQWGWPFAWILLIPIVTVVWQQLLLDQALERDICTLRQDIDYYPWEVPNAWRCPREDVLPTLLPGLLNLVAFAWVLSGRREVRWAALVAGTLGAVRFAAPLLIYGLSGAEVEIFGSTQWQGTHGPEGSVSTSKQLWLLSAVSAIAFLVVTEMADSSKRKRAAAQLLARLRDEGLITDEEYENKRAAAAAVILAPFLLPRLTARYLLPLFYRQQRPTRAGRQLNAAWSWLASTGVLPEKWPGEPVCGPASLEVVGRRSGKPRTNMVTWVEHDGGRYFVSMLGPESDWVRNTRAAGGEAVLRRRGRKSIRLEEVPVEKRAPIIRAWYRRTWHSTLHHIGLEPNADIAEFERIAPRHAVFRIVPQPEQGPV